MVGKNVYIGETFPSARSFPSASGTWLGRFEYQKALFESGRFLMGIQKQFCFGLVHRHVLDGNQISKTVWT